MIIKEDMIVALPTAMVVETGRREQTLRELELLYLIFESEKDNLGICSTLSRRKKLES